MVYVFAFMIIPLETMSDCPNIVSWREITARQPPMMVQEVSRTSSIRVTRVATKKNDNNSVRGLSASEHSFSFVGLGHCTDRYGTDFSQVNLVKKYGGELVGQKFDNVTECQDLCLSLPNPNELVGLEFDNTEVFEALSDGIIDTTTSQTLCSCLYDGRANVPSEEEINAAMDPDTYVLQDRETRILPYTQYAISEVDKACFINTLKIPGESCEDDNECNKDLLCIGEEGDKVCTVVT